MLERKVQRYLCQYSRVGPCFGNDIRLYVNHQDGIKWSTSILRKTWRYQYQLVITVVLYVEYWREPVVPGLSIDSEPGSSPDLYPRFFRHEKGRDQQHETFEPLHGFLSDMVFKGL